MGRAFSLILLLVTATPGYAARGGSTLGWYKAGPSGLLKLCQDQHKTEEHTRQGKTS